MLKNSITNEKWWVQILLIIIFISFAFILTFCTKKTTSPEEQLLAPSNLQISLVENNKIQLSWQDNSTNETKFVIDRKKGVDNWFEKYNEVAANITTFNDIIPTNSDTIYSYRLKAFDDNEWSEYSDTVSWFSENSAPTNLQLEQITQDSIKLTWNDNSIGELNFRVDRKIGNENWQINYKILEPDTTSYIDYNPSLYDTCYYKVFAICGVSYSDSTQNYFIPFLPSPTNLQMEALSATSVKLIWQDNCDREDGYLIYKMEEGSDWDSTNVPANTEEWTDEDVIPGMVNYYKVCAYIDSNYSPYIEGEINTLPPPTNLQIEQQNVHTFKLDWDDNSNLEHGFKIDRKIDYEEWINEIGNVDSNITTWTDSAVGINYNAIHYRVYSYYEEYNSTKTERIYFEQWGVELSAFSATYVDYYMEISWTTESEEDVIGFNIWRNTNNEFDTATKLNDHLIAGSGTTNEPHTYSFADITAGPYSSYYYWLEALFLGGTHYIYGPIEYIP
ncbi:MAG: hypothetical protein KAW92_05655 [Candidatus Cloacimonetes bacterium]|nr:hypothetical protein [Candidatus Cloacimonadota bacterium]